MCGQTFYTRPKNTAVLVTTDPANYHEFACSSDLPDRMDWFERRDTLNPPERRLTFNSELNAAPTAEGYVLDKRDDVFDLTVPSDTLDRAGDFDCQVVDGDGIVHKTMAKLVMLGV